MQTARLNIIGMYHEGCADRLTDALEAVAGVATVCVSLARHGATVQFDERLASQECLLAAVNDAGFMGEATDEEQLSPCSGACGHCHHQENAAFSSSTSPITRQSISTAR